MVTLALIEHPDRPAIFVAEFADRDGRVFHRPCGGGVEFGEPAARALVREFDEEFGTRIEVGEQVAAVENLFTFNGQPGHEYLIVFRACFTDDAFLQDRVFPVLDAETDVGVWRSLTAPPDVPLYPEELQDLVADRR